MAVMAALSAQIVAPNVEFSTLHPAYTWPTFVNRAAPTRYRE
jgi:hypothetical protein